MSFRGTRNLRTWLYKDWRLRCYGRIKIDPYKMVKPKALLKSSGGTIYIVARDFNPGKTSSSTKIGDFACGVSSVILPPSG